MAQSPWDDRFTGAGFCCAIEAPDMSMSAQRLTDGAWDGPAWPSAGIDHPKVIARAKARQIEAKLLIRPSSYPNMADLQPGPGHHTQHVISRGGHPAGRL